MLLQVAPGSLGLQGDPTVAPHDPPGHGHRSCGHHTGQVAVHWALQGGGPPTLGGLLHEALAGQPVCDGEHSGDLVLLDCGTVVRGHQECATTQLMGDTRRNTP